MKRRSSRCRWIRKILALLLLSFCTASLVLMQANYSHIPMLSSLVSNEAVDQKPKIAFLFIARNRLPLDLVWDAFFKGEKEGRFSIYVHSRPGFLFNRDTTRSASFYGRQVNNSIQVDWGESSMIEAERILLRNALKDPFNERFAFVSDSCCIPLYNFGYVYDYIMSTSTSYPDRGKWCDVYKRLANENIGKLIYVSEYQWNGICKSGWLQIACSNQYSGQQWLLLEILFEGSLTSVLLRAYMNM